MKILVTGATGMIGSNLVKVLLDRGMQVIALDRREGIDPRAENVVADLADAAGLETILNQGHVDRIIHLAALAHTAGEQDLSYERYYQVNVTCAENVFKAAKARPVLFVSTVDVLGFTKGVVDAQTPLKPITAYGKTKALAEEACRKLCSSYSIYRFSPVYTPEIKRDIQKRYYLRYPDIAYQVGKGSYYEVLDVNRAVEAMADWCSQIPGNDVTILKDPLPLDTAEAIRQEKAEGRARVVVRIPKWIVHVGYTVAKVVLGENKYTYLLNKVVYPVVSR